MAKVKVNAPGTTVNSPGTNATDQTPTAKLKLKDIVVSSNVCEMLSDATIANIGKTVVDGYRADISTRDEWTKRNAEAMKLALQVVEAKSFPWENCSNVKFPLVTVAALQFLSRVSVLTKGQYPVKCRAFGTDPDGKAEALATRISKHMSWQLTEETPDWMDDDEKTKFLAALLGCAFKKTYFDPARGINVSEFVAATDFVVDNRTKSLDRCNRATHVLYWTKNDVLERERMGLFLKMDDTPPSPTAETTDLTAARAESSGIQEDDDSNSVPDLYQILEQHVWFDMDGDGFKEPYVAFVRLDNGQCLRLVARFFDEGDVVRQNDSKVLTLKRAAKLAQDRKRMMELETKAIALQEDPQNKVVRFNPVKFFTKYTFIPAPDGSFYDLGLGALLGPINESVNSLVNQLIDSGTMNTTAGGFLGRGVKLKGGVTSFNPFEWKPVDSTGDDLRKNIFPLPVRDPSAVLFQLLGTLVTYGEKISGSTDIMTGISPGQNTPAETSRNTIEQGMKIFSGIFARMHRSFTRELEKFYLCNRLYLKNTPQWEALTDGPTALIAPDDYQPGNYRVAPAIDATMVSETQRQQNATMVLNVAQTQGGYDMYLVNRELLEAYGVPNVDLIYPDPKGPHAIPVGEDPKITLKKQELELETMRFQFEQQSFTAELQQAAQLQSAKIAQLQAQATKLLADADGMDTGHQIALLNAQIGAAKSHEEGILKTLQIMQKATDQRQKAAKEGVNDGGAKKLADTAARVARVGAASPDADPAQEIAASQTGNDGSLVP